MGKLMLRSRLPYRLKDAGKIPAA